MLNEDQTSEETLKETSEETAGEGTPETTPIDYKNKFVESQKEAIRLRKELDELQKSKETLEIPEDEKKIREILSKAEKEKAEQEKQEEEQLNKDLGSLAEIYGDFNRDKLLKVVDYFGVYDKEDNVNWDKAMELYNTPGILEKIAGSAEAPTVKKIPTGHRESSQTAEVETPPDVSSKNFAQLVQEGLKKLGIKE